MEITVTDKKLYTTKELREMLGVSRQTIERLRKDGKLGVVKFGRAIRFSREEVDRLISTQDNNN